MMTKWQLPKRNLDKSGIKKLLTPIAFICGGCIILLNVSKDGCKRRHTHCILMNTMDYYNKNVESNGTYVPVERYTDEYCKALTENYKQDTMRSYERWIMKGESAEYYGERLLEILRGEANLDRFRYIEGKKYFKVVRESFDEFQGRNKWRDTTVHAFVDKVTGAVYKPSWMEKHPQSTLDLI